MFIINLPTNLLVQIMNTSLDLDQNCSKCERKHTYYNNNNANDNANNNNARNYLKICLRNQVQIRIIFCKGLDPDHDSPFTKL